MCRAVSFCGSIAAVWRASECRLDAIRHRIFELVEGEARFSPKKDGLKRTETVSQMEVQSFQEGFQEARSQVRASTAVAPWANKTL